MNAERVKDVQNGNVATSLLGVVYSVLYESGLIRVNSLCYNTDQHHTGAKRRTRPKYRFVVLQYLLVSLIVTARTMVCH